ncbi:hypothetical protein Scep_026863 [Stephania cephalantha]|uniref:Uncharacterized protein n=1 Tax=Stephania cephalantha TaxID=152367 RepID=A0AAP0EUW1_9MAGN
MSLFLLPKGTIQALTNTMAKFWWGNAQKERGVHWCSWNKVTKPKGSGGLGFKDIELFNISFVGKQAWRIMEGSNQILSNFSRTKYFINEEFMFANLGSMPSWAWRGLLK